MVLLVSLSCIFTLSLQKQLLALLFTSNLNIQDRVKVTNSHCSSCHVTDLQLYFNNHILHLTKCYSSETFFLTYFQHFLP